MGSRTTTATERERIGWEMCISTIDYEKKTYTHHLSPWSVEFDDPRGRDVVVVRRVKEARVERGVGGRSVTSFAFVVVGRGRLRLRVREDDVLDDVSTGIDGGIGRRADADAAALVVVEVLRISHHPIDGLPKKTKIGGVKKRSRSHRRERRADIYGHTPHQIQDDEEETEPNRENVITRRETFHGHNR